VIKLDVVGLLEQLGDLALNVVAFGLLVGALVIGHPVELAGGDGQPDRISFAASRSAHGEDSAGASPSSIGCAGPACRMLSTIQTAGCPVGQRCGSSGRPATRPGARERVQQAGRGTGGRSRAEHPDRTTTSDTSSNAVFNE
jgi:hypothetical protein